MSFKNILFGFYYLRLKGNNIERFLNICAKNNINCINVSSNKKECTFKVLGKYYEQLQSYAEKTEVELHIVKKTGLIHFFYRYRKRKIFAICFILSLFLLYIASLRIWNINIVCSEGYTDVQVEKYITDNLVKIGTPVSEIDCSKLETDLRNYFDKIAWISCDIDGTTLNVVFTETVEEKMIKHHDYPCNIVAVKDGIITDAIINEGIMLCHKGDEVKKGDILISGVINITNEYDELIETKYIPASGYIYGIVEYNYHDEFSLDYYDKFYTGNKNKSYIFSILGKTVRIPDLFGKKYDNEDIIIDYHNFSLFKRLSLPISVYTSLHKEYELKAIHLSREEAKQKSDLHLNEYLLTLRKKGVVILENNVKIDITDNMLVASGTIVAKELIGVPSDINLINQGEIP